MDNIRDYNVGNSNYATHGNMQSWDIWINYKLNPFDADILKRTLRTKAEGGMTPEEARKLDYKKIIHICKERLRQIAEGITWFAESIKPVITIDMIVKEYKLDEYDSQIVGLILSRRMDEQVYQDIITIIESKLKTM